MLLLAAAGLVSAAGGNEALVRAVNGLTLFYAAWACGIPGIIGGIDGFLIAGGVLVCGSSVLAMRADDPLARKFDGLPGTFPPGWPTRVFVSFILAVIGVGWTVEGLAG